MCRTGYGTRNRIKNRKTKVAQIFSHSWNLRPKVVFEKCPTPHFVDLLGFLNIGRRQ